MQSSRPARTSIPSVRVSVRPPEPPLRIERADLEAVREHFHPGPLGAEIQTGYRRAIAWFGFRSFWGHLRRFAASAIATEDVDTRDWMEPTPPTGLVTKIARTLGAERLGATLGECLERDMFIDFVADSGDDAELAERFAAILFRDYVVADPDDPSRDLQLPRGELLIHGGDVAYPVATVGEIHDRLIVPWNRALRSVGDDTTQRVLLGIPGNHDWYDGLDGFARMFRERHFEEEPEAQTEPLDVKWFGRTMAYVNQFLAGETVNKQKALVVQGYRPLQRASYFVLPLTPNLHLYAVDRQLRRVDYRQKRFFQQWAKDHPNASRIVILPDPVFPFGMPSRSGLQMLRALRLSPEYEPHLCFAGDIHHYRRETVGQSVHVTCGGGGAFLHPVPLDATERAPVEKQWPSAEQCRALLRRVPWHVASGRSGLIAHAVMLLLFAPAIGIGGTMLGRDGLIPGSITAGILTAGVLFLIGGLGEGTWKRVLALAALAGTVMGLLPSAAILLFEAIADSARLPSNTLFFGLAALAVALLAGGFVFGGFLASLTALGLEHTQAFTALAHGSHRHFVRMRVRADGSAVDVFVIGIVDPFAPNEAPVLVDSFRWTPPTRGDEPAKRTSLTPDALGLRASLERRTRSLRPSKPSK